MSLLIASGIFVDYLLLVLAGSTSWMNKYIKTKFTEIKIWLVIKRDTQQPFLKC